MALPKIDVVIFELTLPLSKQTIRFRPFLVKEEKILLMAIESNDENANMLAIRQIITNCVLEDINIDEMTIVDMEYLFLNLRARSISEITDVHYRCNNVITEEKDDSPVEHECGNIVKMSFNLLELEPVCVTDHTTRIELTPSLGIVMKYPTVGMMFEMKVSSIDDIMGVLVSCIDYIYDDETIYYSKDSSREELLEFIESLSKDQFLKLQDFFVHMPKIRKKMEFKCEKCGYADEISLEGIQSFFG